MMRSKSFVSLFVFVALAISSLGAVSVQAQTKPSGQITVWMWKSDWDLVTSSKILDDFAKEYPNVKVNRVDIAAADVYQKLPLAISAGTGAPDVSLVEDSALGRFVALGGLTDLTDKVATYKAQITPYKLDQVTKGGKVYGMPWDIGPVVTYYRRDIFKAAGAPPPRFVPLAVHEVTTSGARQHAVCQPMMSPALLHPRKAAPFPSRDGLEGTFDGSVTIAALLSIASSGDRAGRNPSCRPMLPSPSDVRGRGPDGVRDPPSVQGGNGRWLSSRQRGRVGREMRRYLRKCDSTASQTSQTAELSQGEPEGQLNLPQPAARHGALEARGHRSASCQPGAKYLSDRVTSIAAVRGVAAGLRLFDHGTQA